MQPIILNKIKSHKGNKRIMKEYENVMKNGPKLGIYVNLQNEDLFKWNIKFTNFDEKSIFYKDLCKYTNDKSVYLEIRFQNYPFRPPFVNIITPKFIPQTAHVTSGGAICTELLSSSGWTPIISIENLLVQIKTLIIEGDGRLDPNGNNFKYSFELAQISFQAVAKSHGW
jgi:ubiquitin-conjugating enzyme E2 Q